MINRASVRAQIHPRAHEILAVVNVVVPEGYQHSLLPNFRGVPLEAWRDLHDNRYDLYTELLTICEADFPTWCALLARIVGKGGGGTHPYIFNNSQRYLWNRFSARMAAKKNLWFVILKARQLGMTTLVELLIMFRIVFGYGVNAVIASADQGKSLMMAKKLLMAYDMLPVWLRPQYSARVESDRGKLEFASLNSGVSVQHGNQMSGIARGATPTVYHLSECASFSNAATSGPRIACPDPSTRRTAASMAG